MKSRIKEICKKNFIYFNVGILLTGILIIALSTPPVNKENSIIENYIGAICIAIWYITFPYLSLRYKEKVLLRIAMHVIMSLISLLGGISSIQYFISHKYIFLHSVLLAFVLCISISYCVYMFRTFLKTCRIYVQKLVAYIDPTFDLRKNKIINIIEGITAILVAVTGFIAAISSLLKTI